MKPDLAAMSAENDELLAALKIADAIYTERRAACQKLLDVNRDQARAIFRTLQHYRLRASWMYWMRRHTIIDIYSCCPPHEAETYLDSIYDGQVDWRALCKTGGHPR